MVTDVYLAMPVNEFFGAGTCGKYLLREFSRRGRVFCHPMGELTMPGKPLTADVDMPLIQFGGPELEQQTAYRGDPNVGYLFFEWSPLTAKQQDNLMAFDVLVAGSKWCANVVRGAGFECAAVPQGVDCHIFRPQARTYRDDRFVIYSGGKFEHRKAQDLVLRAVKVLRERHADIELVASWTNIWGDGDDGMVMAREMGVPVRFLPLLSHTDLAARMSHTDVGLFPNRCEGGTNLVLMDYLATGKPVVASTDTGQADVLHGDYALEANGTDDERVEAMIEGVELLYRDRDRLRRMGDAAAQAMRRWPWSRTADGIMAAIHQKVPA